ncbi:MAG: carboxypeptidase regulatory-like domain-containing protein [Acidimicrobiia bacterium]
MLSRFPRFLWLSLSVAVVSSLVPVAASADPNSGAGHLHGLVEDEDGHAVADARIRLWDMASGAAVAEAVTDGDGRYTASLPAGHYDLTANAIKDGTPVEAKVRDVEVAAGRGLNLVLAGMPVEIARLAGTLRDGTGAPIPFAWITVDDGNTVTDAEGEFVLETPEGGRGLRVSPPMADDASVVAETEDFTLDGDQTVDLVLPLVTVDVTVRDRAGSPVAGADVRLQSEETCSSCAGAFELYEGAATSRQATITRRTGGDGKVHLITLPASSLSLTVTHHDGRYQTVHLDGLSAVTSTAFGVELPPAATTMSAASPPSRPPRPDRCPSPVG